MIVPPPTTDQNKNSFPNVRACLFDMDGLLIDSEDIYTFCNNIILHQYGKPSLPWSVKAQLQGRPGPEVLLLLSKPFITKQLTNPLLPISTSGRRNLPRMGSTPHPSQRIPLQAMRPPTPQLPHHATPPWYPPPAQNALVSHQPTRPSRLGHILTRRQFQTQIGTLIQHFLLLPTQEPRPRRRPAYPPGQGQTGARYLSGSSRDYQCGHSRQGRREGNHARGMSCF